MNLEFFIAKKLGASSQKSFTRVITRIAIGAIALSIAVMIIATAIVAGFKNTISEKIFGFWGHIHITSSFAPSSYALEMSPMSADQEYYPVIDTIQGIPFIQEGKDISYLLNDAMVWPNILRWGLLIFLIVLFFIKFNKKLKATLGLLGSVALIGMVIHFFSVERFEESVHMTKGGIRHIQMFANKEGIIKTKDQIEGIVLRGIGSDYDWTFLKQYIKEGNTLNTSTTEAGRGIMISETTAKRLKLGLGDVFPIYFVQEGSSLAKKFKVTGIYKTGLEEYDKRFALVDIRKIQRLNNWRPFKNYGDELWLADENINLLGLTEATAKDWAFTIGRMQEGSTFDLSDTTSLETVIPLRVAQKKQVGIGDTLSLYFQDYGGDEFTFNFLVRGIYDAPDEPVLKKTILVNWHAIHAVNRGLPAQISGFEIFVDDINDLDPYGQFVNFNTLMGKEQYANTLKEMEPNIFDWLNLTDMNERIILLLMILVSIINMTTSLMILILERTNMIGILKALGAQNWAIRKIFLYQAAYIIGLGLLFGNLLGIGLCLVQQQFGIIQLPEDLYYVAVAPVELNFSTIAMLNIGTLVVTVIVLIIPSWLVSKIDPVKAIRFS
ncbi:MAG: ABC transporter permease [Aureispira sp.]|nr:ABC transporter permease [Aureispira sp.]